MIVASASHGQSPPIIGRRCPSEESAPLYRDLTVVWDLNCYINIYLFSDDGHPLQLPAGLPKVCEKLEGVSAAPLQTMLWLRRMAPAWWRTAPGESSSRVFELPVTHTNVTALQQELTKLYIL